MLSSFLSLLSSASAGRKDYNTSVRMGGDALNLKTTKRYSDRITKELVEPGTVLKDVPDERAEELIGAGVAEKLPEKKRAKSDKDE